MKLISKVTEIYCVADDFCKEYELELNKKALSLSNPSINMEFEMEGEVEVKQLTLFLKHSCVKQKLDRKNHCVL